jgi:hypothetical protein
MKYILRRGLVYMYAVLESQSRAFLEGAVSVKPILEEARSDKNL